MSGERSNELEDTKPMDSSRFYRDASIPGLGTDPQGVADEFFCAIWWACNQFFQ